MISRMKMTQNGTEGVADTNIRYIEYQVPYPARQGWRTGIARKFGRFLYVNRITDNNVRELQVDLPKRDWIIGLFGGVIMGFIAGWVAHG